MKATFALLANTEIYNLVRKLSWDIHQQYRTGIDLCRLPPHISLKQPFEISELTPLENYMEELARSINPFSVNLTQLELMETTLDDLRTGILWLNVHETNYLRELHNRINQELSARFGNVSASFDGSAYHFHMSVAIGGQPIATYQQIFKEFSGRLANLQYTIQDLVMFVYDEKTLMNAGFMTYKILPCGR
jgi:2'-5' RNA ligase